MSRVLLIIGLILLFLVGLQAFLNANPAVLARRLKIGVGVVLLAIAAGLAVTGRWALALPAGAIGISLLGSGAVSGPASGASGGGQRSTVRSAALEMELDHDSGAMRGRVLAGTFADAELDNLSLQDIARLWNELDGDDESRALLEAYLDRREPEWRENFEADATAGHGAAPRTGGMSQEEAYQILGLAPGASTAEIRDAHRRLMKRLHPDLGGSTFLASKINEAKERLLGTHDATRTRYS